MNFTILAMGMRRTTMTLPPLNRPSLLLRLWELPNYKYDVSSALIWFRAKRVHEADNVAEEPPAKKEKGSPL